jgi:hypothetical protein
LAADTGWIIRLTPDEAGELASATGAVRERGLRPAEFAQQDFPLPLLGPKLERALDELDSGRGLVLLRGLPVHENDEDGAALLLWGLSLHLGRALRQHPRVNPRGYRDDLIAHIVDQGLDYGAPNVHGSATNAEQMPHSDPADVVGLLCVRPAASGGLSRVASAASVYNALLAQRPHLLDVLYRGFQHDLRGQHHSDASAVTPRIPVYSWHAGRLSCVFNSKTILTAQQKTGVALTPLERQAIDAVIELALHPRLCYDMQLQSGDLQLLNNYTVLHSRTAWTDPHPARRRTMLRVWLKIPVTRPLAPNAIGGYSTGSHYDIARQTSMREGQ